MPSRPSRRRRNRNRRVEGSPESSSTASTADFDIQEFTDEDGDDDEENNAREAVDGWMRDRQDEDYVDDGASLRSSFGDEDDEDANGDGEGGQGQSNDLGDDFTAFQSDSPKSHLIPELKTVMRRMLRCDDLISSATPTSAAPSLAELKQLQYYLWTRFAKILFEEHCCSSDRYSMSLSFHDRSTFEHMTHTIHRNLKFCELLEAATMASDASTDPIAKLANYCMYLVCEGTREALLTPLAIGELVPQILREPQRAKRLPPLSLMFSMFDQDESTIGDAMASHVPKVLLQRTRAIVASILDLSKYTSSTSTVSDAQGTPRLSANHHHQRAGSPVMHAIPLRRPALSSSSAAPGSPLLHEAFHDIADGSGMDVADLPLEGQCPQEERTPRHSGGSAGSSGRKRAREISVATTNSPRTCGRRTEELRSGAGAGLPSMSMTATPFSGWVPVVGDMVGRGPGWRYKHQGSRSDYGRVVGITSTGEVLVKWEVSSDYLSIVALLGFPPNSGYDRVFRYKYRGDACSSQPPEVVPWEQFLRIKTLQPHQVSMKLEELFLMGAVLGILCNQKDTILSCFQYQAVECMLALIDVDVLSSYDALTQAKESLLREKSDAEMAMQMQQAELGSVEPPPAAVSEPPVTTATGTAATSGNEEDGTPNKTTTTPLSSSAVPTKEQLLMEWSDKVDALTNRFRIHREVVARGLWVLNSLLQHKKLACVFLERGGLDRVLHLAERTAITTNLYGCSLIISQLGRSAVFQEVLLHHSHHVPQLLQFVMRQLVHPSTDVRGSVAAFLFHTLCFPSIVTYFDAHQGPEMGLRLFGESLLSSRETHDVLNPTLSLVMLRCFTTYLTSHLMLQCRTLFRRHRALSALLNKPSTCPLPRDTLTVEAFVSMLQMAIESDSARHLAPDLSREAVTALLSPDRSAAFHFLLQHNFHLLLLQSIAFYHDQDRHDLLCATLQALRVFAVPPFCRRAIVDEGPQGLLSASASSEGGGATTGDPTPVRGVATLLAVMEDLNINQKDSINSVVSALQTLLMLVTPPYEGCGDDVLRTFQSACHLVRVHNGIRILLDLLKPQRETLTQTLKTSLFPIIATTVHIMVCLIAYLDTRLLYQALGVHWIVKDLLVQFRDVNRNNAPLYGGGGGGNAHHASDLQLINTSLSHFVEHTRLLMVSSVITSTSDSNQHSGESTAAGALVTTSSGMHENSTSRFSMAIGGPSYLQMKQLLADPFDVLERQGIVARAHLDYAKPSLLRLIVQHLESEGLHAAAQAVRDEAADVFGHPSLGAASPPLSPVPLSNNATSTFPLFDGQSASPSGAPAGAAAVVGKPSLDGIVRSYLRSQHELSTHPIATLPKFDLTKTVLPNMYSYRSAATTYCDGWSNVMNRHIIRKEGLRPWSRCRNHELNMYYRSHRFLFDIRGESEGITAQAVTFCDFGETIIVGTSEGGIALFDTTFDVSEDKLREQHLIFEDEAVNDLVVSPNNTIVAVGGDGSSLVHIMRRSELPHVLTKFENTATVRFAPTQESLVLQTLMQSNKCSTYDLDRGAIVQVYGDSEPTGIETNFANVAQFDKTANLILNDATLWDRRCSNHRPLFQFDRITDTNNIHGCFHPNNAHVIIDKSIWDMRMFTMLFSCQPLHQARVHSADNGQALFAFRDDRTCATSLTVLNSQTYEVIAAHDLRLKNFAMDRCGSLFAGVQEEDADVVVRIYSFGYEQDDENPVVQSEEPIDDDLDSSDSNIDFEDDDEEDDEEFQSGSSNESAVSYSGSSSSSDGSGDDADDVSSLAEMSEDDDDDEAMEEGDEEDESDVETASSQTSQPEADDSSDDEALETMST